MNTAPRIEHREDPRIETASAAKAKSPGGLLPIVIREFSACGLRLSSDVPLHRKEPLVLHLPGEASALHATVVWVRPTGPAEGRKSRTWIAGCRLRGDSVGRMRLPAAGKGCETREPSSRSAWLAAASLVGSLGLLAYLLLKVAAILGGSP